MPSRCATRSTSSPGATATPRLEDVTVALGAELLVLAGLASDEGNAPQEDRGALSSGRAAEIFGRMVAALGGPADFVERPDAHLRAAPCRQGRHAGARRHRAGDRHPRRRHRRGRARRRPHAARRPDRSRGRLHGARRDRRCRRRRTSRSRIVHARSEAAAEQAAGAPPRRLPHRQRTGRGTARSFAKTDRSDEKRARIRSSRALERSLRRLAYCVTTILVFDLP